MIVSDLFQTFEKRFSNRPFFLEGVGIKKIRKVTYLVCVGSNGDAECSSQTKISELDDTFRVNEQILGFEIAVKHTVAVTVGQTGEQLVHVALRKVA